MQQKSYKKVLLFSFFFQANAFKLGENSQEKKLNFTEDRKFKGTIDKKSRSFIKPLLREAMLLMSSGEYKKAFKFLEKAMRFINPADSEMTNKVKLNHIICNKNRKLRPADRLKNAIIRADMAKGLKMSNSLKYCIENEVYIHEISAQVDQCNPRKNYNPTGARVALKLINEYRELLQNEMPEELRTEEAKLKKLEQEAKLIIDYWHYFTAHRLMDSGLDVSAAKVLSNIDKQSILYSNARGIMNKTVNKYGRALYE